MVEERPQVGEAKLISRGVQDVDERDGHIVRSSLHLQRQDGSVPADQAVGHRSAGVDVNVVHAHRSNPWR